jgi:ATP-binding cassette subfamily F protein uup
VSNGDGTWTEYAGGYSDMLTQRRGAAVTSKEGGDMRKSPRVEADRPLAEPPVTASKRKLSFKEKHALETLPARIAALEAEIAALGVKLGEPDLFARDRSGFDQATERLSVATRELGDAETEWLELELLRESLPGGGEG